MKINFRISLIATLALINTGLLYGEPGVGGQPAQPSLTMPPPAAYAISAQDGNSRVWQRMEYEQSPSGKIIGRNHSYTELGTGLNHLVNGQWVEASEKIDILPDGTAAATNGQHQAYFPSDIYAGVIELVTPEGWDLKSRPIGLSYDDGTNTVLIAVLTNSIGQLLGNHQAIYTNAFAGIAADLLYTYTKAGFEQDVVLRQQPPTPESLGLNPGTARLQVMTEFFSPPQPAIQTTTLPPQTGLSLSDQSLGFGLMRMVQGRAFLLGQRATNAGAFVAKQWVQMSGRQFLVEEVPVEAIASKLATLPLTAMNSCSGKASHLASRHLALPPQRLARNDTTKTIMMLAKTERLAPGFVLDYQMVNGSVTNFTFQGDTTYLVTSPITVSGTATFEGGTVIKSSVYDCEFSDIIQIGSSGAINCQTSSYRPAVFTSINDDTVGESMAGSGDPYYTGTPNVDDVGLFLMVDCPHCVLNNLRFSYSWDTIVAGPDNDDMDVWNCQFVNIDTCLEVNNVNLYNVLINQETSDWDTSVSCLSLTAENLTCDGSWPTLTMGPVGELLTNCLLTHGTSVSTDDVNWATAPGPVYQTVGGGGYYLATNSPYRGVGTTNISQELLAELSQKTTCPPVLCYSNTTISTNITFSPQAQRDNLGNPDLGYHYDPLDYIVGPVQVVGATINVNPGTAMAVYGIQSGYDYMSGINLIENAGFLSHGSPDNLSRLVEYNTVQEQTPAGWALDPFGNEALVANDWGGTNDAIGCSFTDFSIMAQDASHIEVVVSINSVVDPVNSQNCQFHGGQLFVQDATMNLTNCLLERVNTDLEPWWANADMVLRNNLFFGGNLYLGGLTNSIIADNLFDRTAITNIDYESYRGGHNAYVTNCNRLTPAFTNDMILASPLNYQTGPLGNYYQPTNSPLINQGSTTADQVGLYYFTVTTNQVLETNSIVDIGYHYVAQAPSGDSLGADFWTAFMGTYDGEGSSLSLYISSPVGASGTVTCPELGITNAFWVAPGAVTNISITSDAELIYNAEVQTNGIHIVADGPVAVYGVSYEPTISTAFTCYPTSLLGTNYCIMARQPYDGVFDIVATEDNTTVTIMPSATTDPSMQSGTITLQQGQTYDSYSYYYGPDFDIDLTGTVITSDKPVGVFAGADIANVPTNVPTGNPLVQEQMPVADWGTNAVALSFAGRTNGDSYRILAAYDNTVITITGAVVTVVALHTYVAPATVTISNEVVVVTNQAGQFYDIIVAGPVEFQASQPIQVAHYANGWTFDDITNTNYPGNGEGDPCEILLPPTGHYLELNTVFTLPNDGIIGDFDENFLNVIVPQSATTNTLVDGSHMATTNFVAIGTSGYYGAQITVTNSGVHTVSSSQPVGMEVYGFGEADAYGYFGGFVK